MNLQHMLVLKNVLDAWDRLTGLCALILGCSTFEQQHAVILGVLWELVVNSNADVKISAAVLSKALVSELCIYSKNLNIGSGIWLLGYSIIIYFLLSSVAFCNVTY